MLAVIHGVDGVEHPSGAALMRCCAGVIIQNAERLNRVILRSPDPSSSPGLPARSSVPSGHVVFPTVIEPEANAPSISTSEWRIMKSAAIDLSCAQRMARAICASSVKW
jgi:hypothetical protein